MIYFTYDHASDWNELSGFIEKTRGQGLPCPQGNMEKLLQAAADDGDYLYLFQDEEKERLTGWAWFKPITGKLVVVGAGIGEVSNQEMLLYTIIRLALRHAGKNKPVQINIPQDSLFISGIYNRFSASTEVQGKVHSITIYP